MSSGRARAAFVVSQEEGAPETGPGKRASGHRRPRREPGAESERKETQPARLRGPGGHLSACEDPGLGCSTWSDAYGRGHCEAWEMREM